MAMAEGWMDAEARAKLNLRLRIFPPTEDGFHPIETIFCRVDVADRVRVRLWPEPPRIWIRVHGSEAAPDGPENLAYRAAALFAERAGVLGGVEIDLEKVIPAGTGLGGGSSDAAAVLRTLERVLHLAGGREELHELAAELGSDVPFFVFDTPLAVGRGRGEILEPGAALAVRPMLIALPDVRVSTAAAYSAWDRSYESGAIDPGEPGDISPLRLADWDELRSLAVNDFEPVIFRLHPELALIKDELEASGASISLLSGSGSAVFGVYEDEVVRNEALSHLADSLNGVRLVSARGPA